MNSCKQANDPYRHVDIDIDDQFLDREIIASGSPLRNLRLHPKTYITRLVWQRVRSGGVALTRLTKNILRFV